MIYDLKTARAQAYDLVFNGLKLAAVVCGFISEIQEQVFEAIGLSLTVQQVWVSTRSV